MDVDFFKLLFLAFFVVGCVIRAICVKRNRTRSETGDHSPPVEWLLLAAVAAGMQLVPFVYLLTDQLDFADYRLPLWVGVIGAGAFATALLLLWRSHCDLGSNFSAKLQIRNGQTLVTHGVYRHIRHPMYAAHLLWAIAQALLLQNWIAGPAFFVAMLPLYLMRVPREEKMMLDHFGDEYRLYMDRTGRLVPPLRR